MNEQIEEILIEFSKIETASDQVQWVKDNPTDATRLIWSLEGIQEIMEEVS